MIHQSTALIEPSKMSYYPAGSERGVESYSSYHAPPPSPDSAAPTPKNRNYLPAESSHRNQWTQGTISNSPQIHGSVMNCSTNSGDWSQRYGFTRFKKRESGLTKAPTVAKPVPLNQIKLPANLTNTIWVVGPCLHPEEENSGSSQKELCSYFSQFGKIVTVSYS
ncbi:hypothetical protein DdX_10922 [Ditylenchus destructor]|uniref:RRM domain-containing protein n=1 Tax=Ditylenchus destructor TaxID=166010 RepID=A0AAD4N3H3_9BILA|nr:hypothetical protein DdX_10922 [Ditylenchus destructor]